MKIRIISGQHELPAIVHQSRTWIVAPVEGDYEIELTNNNPEPRLAVVTVDGRNVVDGQPGSMNGEGYVLQPWATLRIPGWLRTNQEVARFRFSATDGAYAAQMGDGSANLGVIGVAVFEPKPQHRILRSVEHHHHHYPTWWPWPIVNPTPIQPNIWYGTRGTTAPDTEFTCSVEPRCSIGSSEPVDACFRERSATKGIPTAGIAPTSAPVDIGTAYGEKASFFTQTTTFHRASRPSEVLILNYATRERLISWGIPVPDVSMPAPNPFPASDGARVQAPPGWKG